MTTMRIMGTPRGMRRGKVYPATSARHLLNPLRNLVQPPTRVVRLMQLAGTDHVLELGCGPGWFSPCIAASVPDGMLTVCDLQAAMVRIARRRTAVYPRTCGLAADATHLPFASASFDAVLLATMLGEVPQPDQCLAEVRRVLRPTGAVVVAETRRDSDFIPIRQLQALAEAHGFALESVHGPRWEYTARLRPL